MSSGRSPPFNAVGNPSSPSYTDLNDDSNSESESLLRLCKKTLEDVDFVTKSMNSCISDCFSALNLRLFGDSISDSLDTEFAMARSEFPDSDFMVGVADFPDSLLDESIIPETQLEFPDSEFVVGVAELPDSLFDESIIPETQLEFPDSELVVGVAELPDSLLDESIIPETQLEFEGFAADFRGRRKRKGSGGEEKAATAELASAKAVKKARTDAEIRDDMLRILLPSYFELVRSFPIYVLLAGFLPILLDLCLICA